MDEYIYGLDHLQEGGVLLTGWSDSYGAGSFDILLVKTDDLGFSGCDETNASTVVSDPPSEAVTVDLSETSAFTPTIVTDVDFSVDQFLDYESFIQCYTIVDGLDDMDASGPSDMEVFPNPIVGGSKIHLAFQDLINEKVDLLLTDELGRKVREEKGLQIAQGLLLIDIPVLESGIYALTIQTSTGDRYSEKLSVE
jgi:hypothetical protein